MSAAERRARDAFNDAVWTRDNFKCALNPHKHGCSNVIDAHHVIKEQTLKAHTSTLTEEERLAILYDPRNGVCVCRAAHTPLTSKAWHMRPEQVPDHVREFAHDHHLGWALEREVPGLLCRP